VSALGRPLLTDSVDGPFAETVLRLLPGAGGATLRLLVVSAGFRELLFVGLQEDERARALARRSAGRWATLHGMGEAWGWRSPHCGLFDHLVFSTDPLSRALEAAAC
jgi:hypothetical protein